MSDDPQLDRGGTDAPVVDAADDEQSGDDEQSDDGGDSDVQPDPARS